MSKNCNEEIKRVLRISKQLMVLADEGDACTGDDGCSVLFGVVRDCAYKIRGEAEREREAHKAKGTWSEDETA